MAKFVIYDSLYGNTEQVARAIADVTKATLRTVDSITISELRSAELIIVGSQPKAGDQQPLRQSFCTHSPADHYAMSPSQLSIPDLS